MPLYDFACKDCDERFEELVRSLQAIDSVICPTCGSPRVVKQVSSFAVNHKGSGGGAYSSLNSSSSDCAPAGG